MSIYNCITQNFILPISDKILGYSVSKHLQFLLKSQWWSPEQLREFQNERLRMLVKHAYVNVPYYHDIFKERHLMPADIQAVDDLVKLPILTKEDIRRNSPHRIVAGNVPKNQMILAGSSGSTGEPLQYYLSKDAYSFNLACNMRGWHWFGFRLGDRYIKLSQNPREGFINKLKDFVHRCDYVHSQSLTSDNIVDIVGKIRLSQVKTIRGYPSTLYVLSQYITKQQIKDISPLAVTTTGEILFPHMRKAIEQSFNCPVFDSYSGEGGANVFECNTHRGYHVSDEYAITELINDGAIVEGEGKGDIVSTNLWNYATPFIRYNVKDIGVRKERMCTCGRGLPLINSIEGRDSDILKTPSGKYLIVHYFTGYFEWVDYVDQFQVVQNQNDVLTLKLVPNNKFTEDSKNTIYNDIKKYIGDDMQLDIEIVDDIPLTRSGKRRFVIRNIPVE